MWSAGKKTPFEEYSRERIMHDIPRELFLKRRER